MFTYLAFKECLDNCFFGCRGMYQVVLFPQTQKFYPFDQGNNVVYNNADAEYMGNCEQVSHFLSAIAHKGNNLVFECVISHKLAGLGMPCTANVSNYLEGNFYFTWWYIVNIEPNALIKVKC